MEEEMLILSSLQKLCRALGQSADGIHKYSDADKET